MTSSKNVCINQLDDIVNEHKNIYYRTIKMKPDNVKDNTHIDSIKEVNDKNPRFQVGDCVRISKYKILLHYLLLDTLQIGLKRFL